MFNQTLKSLSNSGDLSEMVWKTVLNVGIS